MTQRTLHLIDIENLLPHRRPSLTVAAVEVVLSRYRAVSPIAAHDHVVGACSPRIGLAVGLALGRGRLVVRRGVDGADRALLEAAPAAWVAERFGRVVVASGDHAFAPLVADLRARGVTVDVVAHAEKLSRRLAESGTRVIDITPVPAALAAAGALAAA